MPAERAASMIDEYPVLSVVAAFASGKTHMPGVKELRVKESDRIDAMKVGLEANGITVEDGPDWWTVTGLGHGNVPGGATCASHGSPHRHVIPGVGHGNAAARVGG